MKIVAEKRAQTGTSASKKARAAGQLPAVVYGSSVESMPVLLDLKEFEDAIREVGTNGVFQIDVDGEEYSVFVKDTAEFALVNKLYHVDLQAFTAGEKVVMTIPVYIEGEENIDDGIVSQSISELEIEVAPEEAPEWFSVDVSELEIGDMLNVGSIEMPEGAELISDPEDTLVSVNAPEDITEDLESTETTDVMPEPEVIGDDEEETEE